MRTPDRLSALLLIVVMLMLGTAAHADGFSVGITVGFAPPPLPFYEQPAAPGDGYLWTPGYWGYDDEDGSGYYWVPGTWVHAPRPGLLWTPGYWGAESDYYAWHGGYWGPTVGFYGGINYGFGYFGIGFGGGYWRDNEFCYNRAVTNVTNISTTNIYNNTVVNNQVTNSRVSFNGGEVGTQLRPTGQEVVAARAARFASTNEQQRHELAARSTPSLRAQSNHGTPPIAATPRPAVFAGRGLEASRGHSPSTAARTGTTSPGTDRVAGNAPGSAWRDRPERSGGRAQTDPPMRRAESPRSDRPAWASHSAAQVASGPQSARATPALRDSTPYRPGGDYPSRPMMHTGYPADTGRRAQGASSDPGHAFRESSGYHSSGNPYSPVRAAAPHRAPDPGQAPRSFSRPAYAPQPAYQARDTGRSPSFNAPHSMASPSAPRSANPPPAPRSDRGRGQRRP